MEAPAHPPTPARKGVYVREGEHLLVRKEGKDGATKMVVARRGGKVRFGKLTFVLDNALDLPYGRTYEVTKDGTLIPSEIPTDVFMTEVEDQPTGDNREIIDDTAKQSLTHEDIERMKQEGKSGGEIIKLLVDNSGSFQQRTEFSQAKYLARKQQKYITLVTLLPITTRRLCELMFDKGAQKVLQMRVDSLAQVLTQTTIAPGARVLVADTVQGLVVASVLERLGGKGECVQLHVGDLPPTQLIEPYDFSPEVMSTLKTFPLDSVKVAQAKADESAPGTDTDMEEMLARKAAHDPKDGPWDEAWEQRIMKRNATRAARHAAASSVARGGFDAVIIVTKYEPEAILASLLPLLGLSRSFAVYYPFKEPLVECFHTAKNAGCIRVQLFETWTREYQILPLRSHPENTMSANSGFVLAGIKIAPGGPMPEKEAREKGEGEGKGNAKGKGNKRQKV